MNFPTGSPRRGLAEQSDYSFLARLPLGTEKCVVLLEGCLWEDHINVSRESGLESRDRPATDENVRQASVLYCSVRVDKFGLSFGKAHTRSVSQSAVSWSWWLASMPTSYSSAIISNAGSYAGRFACICSMASSNGMTGLPSTHAGCIASVVGNKT